MTDPGQTPSEAEAAAARRARVEALRARRATGATTAPSRTPAPAVGSPDAPGPRLGPERGRRRRRHVAQGARIAAAGVSLTGLFGLVAAMGAAEARSAQPQPAPAPVPAAAQPPAGVPALTVADDGRLVALPPQALTAAPQVVSVTPDTTATVATTNGSR